MFDKLDQIERFLKDRVKKEEFIVQKYIEAPLLYDGRKMDVKMWGLATSNKDFYFFEEGYLRTNI